MYDFLTFDEEELGNFFCNGCPLIETEADTGLSDCPAGFIVGDVSCRRYQDVEAILEIVAQANEAINDIVFGGR